MPDATTLAELPPRIRDLALAKGIDPATIKLQKDTWVVCEGESCTILAKALPDEGLPAQRKAVLRGLRPGDTITILGHSIKTHTIEQPERYGIPDLGTFTRQQDGSVVFEAYDSFKGTVTFDGGGSRVVQDVAPVEGAKDSVAKKTPGAETKAVITKPYSTEYLKELRALLADNDTTLVLIVSVPKLCGPCRDYKPDIEAVAKSLKDVRNVRFAVIEFSNFDVPRAVIGPIKSYPATFIVEPGEDQQPLKGGAASDEAPRLPFVPALGRPFKVEFGRMTQGPLATFVKKSLGLLGKTIQGAGERLKGR
jgi:thiol-disulfide isomerase/thioredoxin